MKLSDLIEVFKGHDKVLFKLTGIGETEYGTIEFKDAIDTIEALQQENERLKKERDAAFRLLAETQSCDACFYEERCSFSK